MQLMTCILYILITAVLSNFVGAALPRRWFHPERFPFTSLQWENHGRIYQKVGVHIWKDRLPDMSKVFPWMVKKSIARTGSAQDAWKVVLETCVAELVHWVLMLMSVFIYLLCPTTLGAIIAVLYALSHIPFIIIQRYNRPTLITLVQRLKEREERIKHASTDTLSQHR